MNSQITNKAFIIFSDWVTNAKRAYPNLNYQINDPSVLEKDLEGAINKAIDCLTKEEKFEKYNSQYSPKPTTNT